ncbi:inosine monophosphate dehydrogenase [Viridothelium virens]|uniref:Inosine monophosphate dehydrogenase n=1 Tax=Viridothelium virens TaxID=1048519 RepID=A0A6A6HND2_VIRVR|nr:inosine monophosphate dehydrogenase [Viridothelium virens]
MASMEQLQNDYPWTKAPILAGAPMRLISLASLTVEVSRAGGIGFIGAGSDLTTLATTLSTTRSLLASNPIRNTPPDILPLGIGVLNWGANLSLWLSLLSPPNPSTPPPAALWLFAPHSPADLVPWVSETRRHTHGATKIWVQVGSVADALAVTRLCEPDVLVVQGADAGGHGLNHGAGLLPLLPEVVDAVTRLCSSSSSSSIRVPAFMAAGGVLDGRTLAASLVLGAQGAILGTALLASPECNITQGYRDAVVRAVDGGQTTRRTGLYDILRGTTEWPARYGGRGVLNRSWEDAEQGMDVEENKRLYQEVERRSKQDEGAEGWAEGRGRLTTYAGTGVGLVREGKGAGEVVREIREEAIRVQRRMGGARL